MKKLSIPVTIDDESLSPYAVRLYIHIKRACAESGACEEGVRLLAEACQMSVGAVRNARDELVGADIIMVAPGSKSQPDTITTVGEW